MRGGFTIIEILISIAIFTVAATLMFGALFGATEVFRRGEAARQAGDEATAVIAALQEDLSRAVPIRLRNGVPAPEWGRIWASIDGSSGNCRLRLVIENPDPSQVRWVGSGATATVVGVRKQIEWGVLDMGTPDPSDDELVRGETDLGDNGQPAPGVAVRSATITKGCLHFGVWIEVAQAHRQVTAGASSPVIGWEDPTVLPYAASTLGPAMALDTSTTLGSPSFYPQPDALRISLVLTGGGRFATRGTLVRDINQTDLTARISGIKALPTTSGSLLRIEDEWVRYDDFRNGQITIRSDGRGALRSTASAHGGRVTVLAGQPFSLVVALPR